MAKTQKELAFLREICLAEDWTKRFTDLIDKHFEFSDDENLLYINAGTGNHVFALREKINENTAIFATCEDEDTLTIARDKAAAVKADVDFSTLRFEDDSFDTVIADASFVRPKDFQDFIDDTARVAKVGAQVGILTVSAGSFGEVFSLLWEVLFNEDLGEHGTAVEKIIAEIPTITLVKQMATASGLVNIKTHTANEIFEFDNGKAFVESPLVANFLMPAWLETLGEQENERVTKKLAELVDNEDGTMSFRFSVKATLITGEKA
ncbi:MAG TPA: class I SAM-dependent methyltransferase [Pyrinomonadaceae bacterium]|nr:class I SAM-dependent methyltransferase [Pyrinomonadaceae bacterium]